MDMKAEDRMQFYLDKMCFTGDQIDTDNNPRDAWLVTALKNLKASDDMGGPLLAMAAADKIHICAMPHMPAGTGAQYLSGHDLVAAGINASILGETLDLAHEFTHAAQQRNNLLTYYFKWDIQSRVTRNLVDEAAPIALEFAVAYERKYAGDDSYVAYLKKHDAVTAYTDPANHAAFEAAYAKSIDGGTTKADALRAGAHAVFERVFESDNWRNFYLNSELNSYIDDLATGKFKDIKEIQHGAFGRAEIDKAGKVGDLPSWTAGANVPDYTSIMSHDRKMAWAFEAVDIARTRLVLGDDNPETRTMKVRATLNGNPYVGMDFSAVSKKAAEAQFSGSFTLTYRLMDQILAAPTQAPKVQCPSPAKVAGSTPTAG